MRKFWIAILIVCLANPAIYGGYRGYLLWRQSNAIAHALQFVDQKDYNKAMPFIRRVLDINPSNIQANKMMAEYCEAVRSPNALLWRSRLVDLQPNSAINKLNLAGTALLFNTPLTAQKALDTIDERQRKTAEYHKLAGAVATMCNIPNDTEKHLSAALSMEPANIVLQVYLEASRLQHTNPAVAERARIALTNHTNNPAVKLIALRQLATDALHRKQPVPALKFIRQILQDSNSTFGDRLTEWAVLHDQNDPLAAYKLIALENESTNQISRACELAKWMLNHSEAPAALAWIKTLPASLQTCLPMPLVMADCYITTKNWPGLQNEFASQHWADLDCLRFLYHAKALRSQGLNDASKIEFAKATKAAGTHLERLKLLLEATSRWNWPAEKEAILWNIVNRFTDEKWAVSALNELLCKEGKTRSLMILYGRMSDLDPANPVFKNNLAMVALLLDAREKHPHKLAREVYEKEQNNPNFISTYAFSLYLQKKNAEALSVMEQINADQLESPSTAGYYGLVLAATGNHLKARMYFTLAAKIPHLPEETALFCNAMAR